MKTNLFKIMRLALFLLPLLGRGLGGGCVLFAQDLSVCAGKGYTLTSTAAAPATGATQVTYQWYEDDILLTGKNEASLTIEAGTRAPGTYAYWRVAANADCTGGVASNTFTVLVYPAFSPGSITTASTTTPAGTPPGQIVDNSGDASGGSDNLSYVWVRTGTSSATLTGNEVSYDLNTAADNNYSTVGTYYFNRYAKDATCTNIAPVAAAGTYTLVVKNAGPPSGTASTFCTQCCYDGAAWVDCYVTTKALSINAQWIGNNNTTYFDGASGTGSDKNGRANFTAITSSTATIAATSAVGLCKALGDGWYLPAYEELYNMRDGTATSYGNGLDGARILDSYHWSSTEFYSNPTQGRYSDSSIIGHKAAAVFVLPIGTLSAVNKAVTSHGGVRCAWRP